MVLVKASHIGRLLVAFQVSPALSIREDWSRTLFERLQDEFPQLLGLAVIERDQFATFLRPASEGEAGEPICQIQGQGIQVVVEKPSSEDAAALPAFVGHLYRESREIFHIAHVRRVGRVQQTGYILDSDSDAARDALRDCLTKLGPQEADDVQLQFSVREDIFNVNLTLRPAASSNEPGPTGIPIRDILVAQSDVNNWDMRLDVDWGMAERILVRGAKHANEDVPAFIQTRLGLEIRQG